MDFTIEDLERFHQAHFVNDLLTTETNDWEIDSSCIEELSEEKHLEDFKKVKLNGDTVLSKSISRDANSRSTCREEYYLMKSNHENVHRCLGHYYKEGSGDFNLLFENVDQNLITYMQEERTKKEKIKILIKILKGLSKVHSKKFSHNNLHPRSIYLRDGSVRIGNFSQTSSNNDGNVQGQNSETYEPREDDIFKFGLLILFVFTGRDHYNDLQAFQDFPEQIRDEWKFQVPEEIRPILSRILYSQPNNRPKASNLCEEFKQLLLQPFYNFIDL